MGQDSIPQNWIQVTMPYSAYVLFEVIPKIIYSFLLVEK